MTGILLRVGIDTTCGNYVAPTDPDTNDYLYFPIPQSRESFRDGMATTYNDLCDPFAEFVEHAGVPALGFPNHLLGRGTHLDPDFDHLTYGDQSTGRGNQIGALHPGDFIVFYASFNPVRACDHNYIYALFGIYWIDEITRVRDIAIDRYNTNAHTRVVCASPTDLVVRASPQSSGRFERAIPIGEYRNRAYRVSEPMLESWGGLSVRDGYIQRSVNPPRFQNPERFLEWLNARGPKVVASNW